MIGVLRLPWVQNGPRYVAHTLWGTVELRPLPEPWTSNLAAAFSPFSIPKMGYGIFLSGKRIGWTIEAADAASAAAGLLTARANEAQRRHS